MNLFTRKLRLLLGVLTLAVALYNCQPKEVASLTPFTYTFKAIEDIKLPTITPTAPAAVTVVDSKVISSTAATALTNLLSSTVVTPAQEQSVSQTAAQITNVISQTQAAAIAALTPDEAVAQAQSGSVPANIQSALNLIANDPVLQQYLDAFTPPVVNGVTVTSGRVGAVEEVAAAFAATADIDACKKTANDTYNTALANLVAQRTAQTTEVNNTYNQAVTTINNETAPCRPNVTSRYTSLRASAVASYRAAMAALPLFVNRLPILLRTAVFNAFASIFYARLVDSLADYTRLENLDLAACDRVKNARLASAQNSQTADLNKINQNFATQQAALQAARDKAVVSCHNQGKGGN